jgi:hypothetical protein
LAGHIAKLGRPWREVRANVSVKENVFIPFSREHYRGLLERCPELAELQRRVCEALDQSV